MLIFSIAIRIKISARGAALLLYVLHLLNTDLMPCRHLTDAVTRPIVNLCRGEANGEVSACAIAGVLQICLTRKTILPMIVM
jgi:hypothetical protein